MRSTSCLPVGPTTSSTSSSISSLRTPSPTPTLSASRPSFAAYLHASPPGTDDSLLLLLLLLWLDDPQPAIAIAATIEMPHTLLIVPPGWYASRVSARVSSRA